MRKLVVIVILLAFIVGLTLSVDASVSEKRNKRVLNVGWVQPHRYVMGCAAEQLGPNFLDNDWDEVNAGSWSNLTAADKAYLKTCSGLNNGTWYSIDLTTRTVSTNGFSDYSYTLTDVLDPYTTTITTVNVTYELVLKVYDYSPIVLDLNNDGKIDVAKNNWRPHAPKFYREFAKFFDITGDGADDYTEWMMPNAHDGLLVMPENGEVKNALQLFGTAGGYRDGYEKLSIICDKDSNGWVEGEELEGLAIWMDENNDAVCQPEELKQLSDYNIKKISTNHKDFISKYETNDGKTLTTWDWWPAMMETRKFHRK